MADEDRRPPPWTWDEIVLACDLVVANDWRGLAAGDSQVLELSRLLQALPTYPAERRGTKFRNPNGVARKTVDLATNHPAYTGSPTNGGRLDLEVIRAFMNDSQRMADIAAALRGVARLTDATPEQAPDLDLDLEPTVEGQLLQRLHLIRERDPKLRARKIKGVRERLGHIRCEVCTFDFENTYGDRGRDYIECHHTRPLSQSRPTRTTLADLALLCSNCHRMIHRRRPWLTLDQLRELVG